MTVAFVVQVALLLLSAVFLVSGVAKFLDLAGAAKALSDFGLPEPMARVGARVLPGVEMVVGLALLVPPAAGWAALGATVLLAAFTAAMAVQLGLGRRPACHCFGKLSTAPIGPATLVRNGALTTVAVALAWHASLGHLGSWAWAGALGWSEWLSVAAISASAIVVPLLLALWLQQGRILRALAEADGDGRRLAAARASDGTVRGPGLQIGSRVPALSVDTLQGVAVELFDGAPTDRPTLLVFVSAQCGPCIALMPDLHAWQTSQTAALGVTIVASGARERVAELTVEHRLTRVLHDVGGATARALRVPATPAALLVGPDRTVLTEVMTGQAALRLLAARGATEPRPNASGESPPVVFDRAQGTGRGTDTRGSVS